MSGGVFAVSRGVFDHPSFAPEPYTEREAWLWLIGDAAWKPHKRRAGRVIVDLKRGQTAHATRFLATKWKWSEARVRRFLNRLKIDAMVELQATRETTQITICNYDKYAFDGRTGDAPSDAQTDAPATHARRRVEEVKKDKKEEDSSLRSLQPRKRKTSLPEDWKVSESGAHYAIARGWTASKVHTEGERFKNHAIEKERLFAGERGIEAAWRNWVTSPYQRAGPQTPLKEIKQTRWDEAYQDLKHGNRIRESGEGNGTVIGILPPVTSQ